MNLRLGLVIGLFCLGHVFAQSPIGTVQLVDGNLLFANGNQAYSLKNKGGTLHITCIHIETRSLIQGEFTFSKSRFASSFILLGKNSIYLVEQSSATWQNGLFDDVRILCWNGKDGIEEYNFPGYLNGGVIRYALADDEQMYFLTDQQHSGFSESDIYQCKHNLLHFTRSNYLLRKINYGLSVVEDSPFTSFWFPLRIETHLTEWYRVKYRNKKIVFEVQQLQPSGNNISSTEITCDLSPGLIPSNTETPPNEANIYYDFRTFSMTDTSLKTEVTSMLTLALLQYNSFNHQYFSTFKLYADDAKGHEGFYFMLLDSNLNTVQTYETYEMIKNPTLTASLPDFSKTNYKISFNNQGGIFLSVEYTTYLNKLQAHKAYTWKNNAWVEVNTYIRFDRLKGFQYPGFIADEKCRTQLSGMNSNLMNTPYMVCTGKNMLYIFPTLGKNNVWSVGVE
jgi:hypothetical protein